jgi:voltage-gated potassium channel
MKKFFFRLANTPRMLVLTILGTVLVSSTVFSLAEGVSFFDGVYWSVVTMTTTGYGDLSPASVCGKVYTMSLMLWSVFFLVPSVVAHIIMKFIHDENEFTHEEQETIMKQQERILELLEGGGDERG